MDLLEDCNNLENCFCVRIIPMRNVVEESTMRNRGMHRTWGEEEMERRDCPIILMVVEEEGGVQDDAIMSSGISSKEGRIFSLSSPPAASQ